MQVVLTLLLLWAWLRERRRGEREGGVEFVGPWKESQWIYDVWALLWEGLSPDRQENTSLQCVFLLTLVPNIHTWHTRLRHLSAHPSPPPAPFTFHVWCFCVTRLKTQLVMMQLIDSGVSEGKTNWKKTNEEKREGHVRSPEPRQVPDCGKSVFIISWSPCRDHRFQEVERLSTHSLMLPSHLWLL